MDETPKMPRRIGTLALWYTAVYLVVIRLRDFVDMNVFSDEINEWRDPHLAALKITSGLAFFAYCLSCYLLLYYYYQRLRWFVLLPLLSLTVLASMFFRAFLEEVIIYLIFGSGNYNPEMSWGNYLIDNLYYAVVFTSLGIVFFFVQHARFSELALRRSQLLQKETELRFLRSQTNPHFLFNTLNNLYSLVHANSQHALPALEKLSGLLRYALYEQEQLVPLAREISYLEDLLHLESLRVEGLVPPNITIGPFTRPWQLPPLLLVPFVENAFKHGELRDADRPLRISLNEKSDGQQLIFNIKNAVKKNANSSDNVGGIGLANVRKRLALLLPELHSLTITEGDPFEICLIIEAMQENN